MRVSTLDTTFSGSTAMGPNVGLKSKHPRAPAWTLSIWRRTNGGPLRARLPADTGSTGSRSWSGGCRRGG